MRVGKAGLSLYLIWLFIAVSGIAHAAPPQADPITKEELKPLLGRSDVVVIDMRYGRDWNDATLKIKGAVREDPLKPGQWLDKYPKEKMIIFYCA